MSTDPNPASREGTGETRPIQPAPSAAASPAGEAVEPWGYVDLGSGCASKNEKIVRHWREGGLRLAALYTEAALLAAEAKGQEKARKTIEAKIAESDAEIGNLATDFRYGWRGALREALAALQSPAPEGGKPPAPAETDAQIRLSRETAERLESYLFGSIIPREIEWLRQEIVAALARQRGDHLSSDRRAES
jgi:hypothetical protein